MNYNIKGTELAITGELREYVEKSLRRQISFCTTTQVHTPMLSLSMQACATAANIAQSSPQAQQERSTVKMRGATLCMRQSTLPWAGWCKNYANTKRSVSILCDALQELPKTCCAVCVIAFSFYKRKAAVVVDSGEDKLTRGGSAPLKYA